jgi:hypothetical protein
VRIVPLRRKYHFLVYEPGSHAPNLFVSNPMFWYPTLETVRAAAQLFACEHDRGVRVEILKDRAVVEKVIPCSD